MKKIQERQLRIPRDKRKSKPKRSLKDRLRKVRMKRKISVFVVKRYLILSGFSVVMKTNVEDRVGIMLTVLESVVNLKK